MDKKICSDSVRFDIDHGSIKKPSRLGGSKGESVEKQCFRIGELAEILSQDGVTIEPFVIRFWERQFAIRAHRSDGGQRFYSEEDLKRFATIKQLLYEKKFTIAGAKKFFQSGGKLAAPQEKPSRVAPEIVTSLKELRTQLEQLKALLEKN